MANPETPPTHRLPAQHQVLSWQATTSTNPPSPFIVSVRPLAKNGNCDVSVSMPACASSLAQLGDGYVGHPGADGPAVAVEHADQRISQVGGFEWVVATGDLRTVPAPEICR